MTLRDNPIPKYYLSLPYAVMGAVLLISSIKFYRQFATRALLIS
jgi:hypothetical protein